MNLFKKTISSPMSLTEISIDLMKSGEFIGGFENNTFEIREKSFYSNKLLFPIITGVIDDQKDKNTSIVVSLKLFGLDKLGIGLFFIISFLLSISAGIANRDFFMTLIILSWVMIIAVVLFAVYMINCRRALKKFLKLTNSTIIN